LNYTERKPIRPLANHIECFWFAASNEPPANEPERVLPDGCLEWIFHVGTPFLRLNRAQQWERQPRSFVVGELTRFILLQPTGPVTTMGVRFRPGGAYRFLPLPVHNLTDDFVSTRDIWGRAGELLEEAVIEARSNHERQERVEAFLLSRLLASEPRRRFDAAIGALMLARGQTPVNQIAAQIGCSPRQLERECRAHAGLSPKALARVIRFQNLLRLAGESALRHWSRVALDSGYADQSHMVREFRDLAGQSPTERDASPAGALSSYFVSPQRLADLLGST
jgi:AraC-like DNA-binding protein